MKILVTGGLGFIGSHLCEALAESGHQLTIVDDLSTGRREHAPKGSKVIIDDVAKAGVFDELVKTVDACYHLAAIASVQKSKEDPVRCHAVNAGGLENLFAAIRKTGKTIPVVLASSAAVYGDNDQLPLDENARCNPISAYGEDKLACEHAGKKAAQQGIPNIALRFFNVFGERQDPASPYSGVISIFAHAAQHNQPITIYGDGEQSRDFIYVGDVVAALTAAMDALLAGRITQDMFNVCTGTQISVNKLAGTLAGLTGHSAAIGHAPARSGDIRHSLGNPQKLQHALGIKEHTLLSDGLRLTLEWLKTTA